MGEGERNMSVVLSNLERSLSVLYIVLPVFVVVGVMLILSFWIKDFWRVDDE